MMTDETQTEISVEALKAGDRAEFARLVDLASAPIYRLGLKMLGNPQDAEDVLQNTFLKALQSLGNFEGRSSPLTWLYRIAINEALMLIRRQKPQVEIAEEPQDEESNLPTPVQLTDWCCLPESDFLTTESKRALDAAILKLPEKLRVVFLLRDIEGMSIQETSEALGLTETAVKTRLLRARLNLREQLSSYFTERLIEEREK
ncbi:MAG: sigma-70 family RNA polymerase sigma factor [Chloroflexi bacterium]|nr:sigma-70 family RNA polymerase sigma factor [Chloroflexota bacterium]